MPKRMPSPNAPALSFIHHMKHYLRQKCRQYILKWDAVGSILKQTKGKHVHNTNILAIFPSKCDLNALIHNRQNFEEAGLN